MTNLKNRSIAGSAALIATILSMTVAVAPLRAETVRVAYGDLDVRTDAGAVELEARIRRAAGKVCGQADANSRFQVAACRSHAVKAARAQLAMKTQGSDVKLASR